jgi:hypothetical protein
LTSFFSENSRKRFSFFQRMQPNYVLLRKIFWFLLKSQRSHQSLIESHEISYEISAQKKIDLPPARAAKQQPQRHNNSNSTAAAAATQQSRTTGGGSDTTTAAQWAAAAATSTNAPTTEQQRGNDPQKISSLMRSHQV